MGSLLEARSSVHPRYGLYVHSGAIVKYFGGDIEGNKTAVLVEAGAALQAVGVDLYTTVDGGPAAVFLGTGSIFLGRVAGPKESSGDPPREPGQTSSGGITGIQLGDVSHTSAGNIIIAFVQNCSVAAVNATYDDGSSRVLLTESNNGASINLPSLAVVDGPGLYDVPNDAGASFSWLTATHGKNVRLNVPITATRSMVLANAEAVPNDIVEIHRTAAATGAFNWQIQNNSAVNITTLTPGQRCRVAHIGGEWVLWE